MALALYDIIEITEGADFEVKKAAGRDGLGQLPGSFFETYSAMANTEGGMSLYVVKRQDMFGFRNPGLMRVPVQQAVRGGNSDCRNRNLQKMFQLVGLAEQAGSGLPKVYRNWKKQHWRRPELVEQINPEQTILRLRMVSLLPDETLAELDKRFGAAFRELPETARLALATASIEGSVTHTRLREMCADHPKDLSKTLAWLVEHHFLVSRGATRGTIYYFRDKVPDAGHDGAGGLTESEGNSSAGSSQHSEGSSQHSEGSSQHTEGSSQHNEGSSQHSKSSTLESLEQLRQHAAEIRATKRVSPARMLGMILDLCRRTALTAPQLSDLLGRNVDSIKNHYLRPLVARGDLRLLYPDRPSHPQQAYLAPPDSTHG